jgi:hypothetical protein
LHCGRFSGTGEERGEVRRLHECLDSFKGYGDALQSVSQRGNDV